MPRIYARAIRPRQRPWPPNKLVALRILRDAGRRIAKIIVGYFEMIVADWEHRPEFGSRVVVDLRRGIHIYVWPKGEHADVWRWVSGGTEPHTIVPRNAGVLHFKAGYKPRTTGGGRYKGPGKAVGPDVFAMHVEHPGSKARKLERDIARWVRQRKDVPNIWRGAMRQIARAL